MVREWSVDQRKFLLKRKHQGATLAVIQQEYAYWWPPNTWHIVNALAPTSKYTLRRLVTKWNNHQAMLSDAASCSLQHEKEGSQVLQGNGWHL